VPRHPHQGVSLHLPLSISTYLFSLAIAPYRVWNQTYISNNGLDTLPIIHCVYPENYQASLTTYGQTPAIMAVFEEALGPILFWLRSTVMPTWVFRRGMENQTITSMSKTYQGFLMSVIVHEMSHQWWGDLVTCKTWHDIC